MPVPLATAIPAWTPRGPMIAIEVVIVNAPNCPLSSTTIWPPSLVCASAPLNDRQGWASEHEFTSEPYVATYVSCCTP